VQHMHPEEQHRPCMPCPTCAHLLPARGPVHRCVETMVGAVELERPYFYGQVCRTGTYPLDAVLGVSTGRLQRDVQQTAVALATEVPYETASTLFGRLSGMTVSSERIHTITHQVAADLGVVEVAPAREEIDRRVAQVAAGRLRRPGQARHRARRARWRHEWREAKGFRLYLLDGERIVHVLSWHQVHNEQELGEALQQVKDAHLIPEETMRLCVICDGAEWIWKHVQALFPQACQVLDYYHCAAYLHKVAKCNTRSPYARRNGLRRP
jgi:uncharacterized protein UPF0236